MKIRYYGHIGQPTGYGRAASDLCMALLGAGVSLELRPLSPPSRRVFTGEFLPLANFLKLDADLDPHPDAVIVHTLPIDCPQVRETVMNERITKTSPSVPWIAYTTWEALTRPVELRAMMYPFHQVWHPSRANAEALLSRGPAKILPHCFDPETLTARREPGTLPRDPNGYYFYYVGAWSDRKNTGALVSTFHETFDRKRDNAHLVLLCAGAPEEKIQAAREMLDKRVHIAGTHASDKYVLEMHRLFDCYVTASHGEAWNLPCFDAMLAGRQIVAPMGLGSDDYLDDTDANLYDTRAGNLWLDPDLGMLSLAMRDNYNARHRDLVVDYDPVQHYGYPAVAQTAINYISECYS